MSDRLHHATGEPSQQAKPWECEVRMISLTSLEARLAVLASRIQPRLKIATVMHYLAQTVNALELQAIPGSAGMVAKITPSSVCSFVPA